MSLLLDALRRSEDGAVAAQTLPTVSERFVSETAGAQEAAQNLLDARPQASASRGRRVRVLAGVAGVMALSMAGWLGWEYWESSQLPVLATLPEVDVRDGARPSAPDEPVPVVAVSVGEREMVQPPPAAVGEPAGPAAEAVATVAQRGAVAAVRGGTPIEVPAAPARARGREATASTQKTKIQAEKPPSVPPSNGQPLLVRSDANRLLQDAWAALSQGDVSRALVLYREVLSERPDDPDATLGVAVALHQQKNLAPAWAAYQRSLKLWPDNATARTGLLAILAESDVVTAESRLNEWVQSRPGDAAAQAALGNLLARQSRWAEALPWLLRAQSLEPRRAAYAYNLAVALDQSRRYTEAAQHYRLALQLGGVGVPATSVNDRLQELAGLETQ